MNKRQLEVEKIKLAAEAKELEELKAIYQKAADDISKKIRISDGKINVLLQNFDDLDDKQKSILQSQIYQRKFQQSLKQQIDDFTNALVAGQYESIDDYMRSCYEVGFLGAMYDIQGQGVPLVMPIDEKQVIKAMQTNSKISKRLYTKLGEDVDALKKRIASSLSRGIATADSYANIARNITADSNVGFNRAMRIARTEGHRIQANSAFDAQQAAKAAGADVVKQWDSTLDGKTRPHHRQLDGQIRELEEPFEVGGMKAMYPADFGRASEDVNCRCALVQRARWALDDGEFTKMNNFTKELETFESPKSYDEFKKGFFSDGNVKYMNYVQQMEKKYKTKDFNKVLASMTEREYKHFSKLQGNNPVFNVTEGATKAAFVPAKTIAEAEEYAKRFVVEKTWSGDGNISYKGLSIESANKLNETLTDLFENNDIPLLTNIQPMNFRAKLWKGSENVPMAYRSAHSGELYFNPKIMKNAKMVEAYMQEGKNAYKICAENIDKFTGADRKLIETYLNAGRSLIAEDVEDAMKAIIEHEMGHHIQHNIIYENVDMAKIVAEGYETYGVKISGYATKTYGEYIAESYAAFCNGKADIIDPNLKKIFEGIKTGEKAKVVEKSVKSSIIQPEVEYVKIIPDAKFVDYALNPSNDPNKAKVFKSALGYSQANYQELKEQIMNLADETKFVKKGDSGYGMRYEYILEITGANGKKANVLTAWIQDGENLRLTSVYVTKRKVTE